jgi:hypothetical protein
MTYILAVLQGSDLSGVGERMIEVRIKLRRDFGALLFVRCFAGFTAKLMIKIPSAK